MTTFSGCVVMGWFTQIYLSLKHQLMLALVFSLVGVSMEFLQGWGGQRYFEFADMLANTTGVLFGWWLSRRWCAGWLSWLDVRLARIYFTRMDTIELFLPR